MTGCCSKAVGADNIDRKGHRLRCVVESHCVAEAHRIRENTRKTLVRKHIPDRWSDSGKTGHWTIEVGRKKKCSGWFHSHDRVIV